MKFNLISYPIFFKGEVEIIIRLLQTFDFTLHLRKPNASAYEYEAILNSIPEYLHSSIVIHNAFELTKKYNLKGIHFSEKYRKSMSRLQTDLIKSTSCHTINELCEIDGKYPYSFISPIFKSDSKPFYYPGLDIQELNRFLNNPRKIKVIALGGINEYNIYELKEMQFDGIAVLGGVWKDKPDDISLVLNNFKKIYNCFMPDFQL